VDKQLVLFGSLEECAEHLLSVRSHLEVLDLPGKSLGGDIYLSLLLCKIHVDLCLEHLRGIQDATPPF